MRKDIKNRQYIKAAFALCIIINKTTITIIKLKAIDNTVAIQEKVY